jgi:hypothetical protein
VDGLRRVNVFVGANNVGKTSVLEAIYLLQELQVSDAVRAVLQRRKYRATVDNSMAELFQRQGAEQPVRLLGSDGANAWTVAMAADRDGYSATLSRDPALPQSAAHKYAVGAALGDAQRHGRKPAVFFDFAAMEDSELAERIGAAIVKRRREKLVAALQRVDPRVVGVDQYKLPKTNAVEAWVDVGLPELLRMTQAGHGLRYAASLFTELDRARDAVVLIDEFEVGLHHDVIAPVWQTIDALSRDNQLQIFATTHSYECLEAADRAMEASPDDLAVFRIERLGNGKMAVFRLGRSEREASFHYHSEVR